MEHKRFEVSCILLLCAALLFPAAGQAKGLQPGEQADSVVSAKQEEPVRPRILSVGPMAAVLGSCERETHVISVGPMAVMMAALQSPSVPSADPAANTGNETNQPEEAEAAQTPEAEDETVSEYADLAIAHVKKYVNIRKGPGTEYKIVGKIYNGAVAHVLETAGEENDWFKIISGNAEGYIKAEYFYYGSETIEVIDQYVTRYAVVQAKRLNVRREPDVESKRIGYLNKNERAKIVEKLDGWYKVEYTSDKLGYVSAEYVEIAEEFIYAKTLAEEAAELAAKKELEERQHASEASKGENVSVSVTPPSGNYSTNAELRKAIIDFAMQFLGNRYVHGGRSLQSGTDCSGFTSLVYKEFGYSLSRTPSGQYASAGRKVSFDELQPGDIICYGKSGCTHVGLYIGNGQVLHSANPRKGVVISSYDCNPVLGFRNVID